eukprot:3962842-Amphidinium_carterae.3
MRSALHLAHVRGTNEVEHMGLPDKFFLFRISVSMFAHWCGSLPPSSANNTMMRCASLSTISGSHLASFMLCATTFNTQQQLLPALALFVHCISNMTRLNTSMHHDACFMLV